MKSENAVIWKKQLEANQYLLSGIRHRILSLFDLQFILVTGRNRKNQNVTYGELVNNIDSYRADFIQLASLWGIDNPILRPLKIALSQLVFFEKQIRENTLDECDLVSSFANNEPEFVFQLSIEITRSLRLIEGIDDAREAPC